MSYRQSLLHNLMDMGSLLGVTLGTILKKANIDTNPYELV